jgi:ABC-type uncharacterized transport system substrate-binding protein
MDSYIHRWNPTRLLFSTLLFCLGLTAAHADIQSVLIVKSSENPFFNTTTESLINQAHARLKFNISTQESLDENPQIASNADLIITLGLKAASHIEKLDVGIPVIHSYLTEFQYKNHKPKANHTTLLLDQPLHRYIRFIDLLLDVNTVGIIKSPNDRISPETISRIDKNLNITIHQTIFENDEQPINAVRSLLQHNDLLLILPAPNIYNRQSLKGILLASYRLNKPVISYSPSHVKSGALAAIYTSPEDIGKQMAKLLNLMVINKDFTPKTFYYAEDFHIVVNKRVKDSLNLQINDESEVLKALKKDIAQ